MIEAGVEGQWGQALGDLVDFRGLSVFMLRGREPGRDRSQEFYKRDTLTFILWEDPSACQGGEEGGCCGGGER